MKRVLAFLVAVCVLFACTGTTAYAKENAILNISKDNISHDVSTTLYGITLEDLAYSCDGGLVSNLVSNGSFEYNFDVCPGWNLANRATISTNSPMNDSNTSYAIIHLDNERVVIKNNGFAGNDDAFAGMSFVEKTEYQFSCYVKNISFDGTIGVYLDSSKNDSSVVQISNDSISPSKWTQLSTKLKSTATQQGSLAIVFDGTGDIQLDMVSLVPRNSYGYGSEEWKYTSLRTDMVDALKALNPSFIRFPGGCVAEGADLDDLYCWKDTIGPLDTRHQSRSVWDNPEERYINNTCAMGYHEYFQLCMDLGAEPVPVVSAGITCQQSNGYIEHSDALKKLSMDDDQWQSYLVLERGFGEHDRSGMQDYTAKIDSLGINSQADFDAYIDSIALQPGTDAFVDYTQDLLDLIEYANGDPITTYWGAQRSLNGHAQPFDMKYICIGNENWGEAYSRNFNAIKDAIKSAYPDMIVVAASQPNADFASSNGGDMLDEHFAVDEDYFLQNNARYDSYDRDGAGVMIGQLCCTEDGNTIYSSVQESSMLTGAERNSDIVSMTAVGPSIARTDCDNVDNALIWFDNDSIALTPSFYSQMLFANNTGTQLVNTTLDSEDIYHSVTINDNAQVLYIKLVNSSSSSASVGVNLDGFEQINLVSAVSVDHKHKDATNTVDKQTVAPQQTNIVAENGSFSVDLGANSVCVVRVAYGDNLGLSLWQIPDTIDVETSSFVPKSMKVLIIVLVVGFGVGTAGGYLAYTRVINKNANPKRIKKKREKDV